MTYTLRLGLIIGESVNRMSLTVLDRNKNILPVQIIEQHPGMLSLIVEITMPNKILICLTGKDHSIQDNSNMFVEVKHMSLGGIRINNKKLDDLFEYKADRDTVYNPFKTVDDYLQLESDKTTHWNRNGCAILELFDIDPIRYHLHLETTGLATI
jgi:hypothetical protein